MGSKLLKFDEMVAMTPLTAATHRWLRHNNTGPKAAKFGRRLVYREEDVQEWIDAHFADDKVAS